LYLKHLIKVAKMN